MMSSHYAIEIFGNYGNGYKSTILLNRFICAYYFNTVKGVKALISAKLTKAEHFIKHGKCLFYERINIAITGILDFKETSKLQ